MKDLWYDNDDRYKYFTALNYFLELDWAPTEEDFMASTTKLKHSSAFSCLLEDMNENPLLSFVPEQICIVSTVRRAAGG